jgi:hypothetical protein
MHPGIPTSRHLEYAKGYQFKALALDEPDLKGMWELSASE